MKVHRTGVSERLDDMPKYQDPKNPADTQPFTRTVSREVVTVDDLMAWADRYVMAHPDKRPSDMRDALNLSIASGDPVD